MKYKKIAFVGMPGCGKSTVGHAPADKTNINFIDTDEEFIKKFYNIADFFKNEGEDKFRRIEEDILCSTTKSNTFILSTGGGIILSSKNRQILFNSDIYTIYLKAAPDVLYSRTLNDLSRPLINTVDRLNKISELLVQRENFYNMANLIINTDNLSINEIVNIVNKKVL